MTQSPGRLFAEEADIHIVVLGAGPAGAAAAIGLKRLGYRVTCISRPRRPVCIEGISERVYSALSGLGLSTAMAHISKPVPRQVVWNGQVSATNTERLVDREHFDAGILDDLKAAGIAIIADSIELFEHRDTHPESVWQVKTGAGTVITANFIVDARGRRAPHRQDGRLRGPESVAMSQFWQLADDSHQDASVLAVALKNGWGWLVQDARGRVYTQLSLSANRQALPSRGAEAKWIKSAFGELLGAGSVLSTAKPLGKASFRGCTSILNAGVVTQNYLRIGDAAMAVDPLSGNGIFQSLSSALVAPAVINTLIRRPEDAALAQHFYEQRLEHLYMRFARIGRDFYRQMSGADSCDYWQERQAWPDDELAHLDTDRILGVARRPVVNNGFIELAEVLLTHNQPLGIWKVDGESVVERYRQQQSHIQGMNK